MITVLLADDHSIVRDGLRRVLEDSSGIKVIAEASDGENAFDQAMENNRTWQSLIFPCPAWTDWKWWPE